jgi:hypothetical protein
MKTYLGVPLVLTTLAVARAEAAPVGCPFPDEWRYFILVLLFSCVLLVIGLFWGAVRRSWRLLGLSLCVSLTLPFLGIMFIKGPILSASVCAVLAGLLFVVVFRPRHQDSQSDGALQDGHE